jgi:hypothetical protein
MAMTGHRTSWAFYTWAGKWKLKPFARARYRRDDVNAAIARAAITKGNGVRRMSPRKQIL